MPDCCFYIEDLFELSKSVIYDPDNFESADHIITDTRLELEGAVFLALKGDKFDGHRFIPEAVKKGCSAVIVNEEYLDSLDDIEIPIITVPDTAAAYGELANIRRKKLDALVISITGSSGKTTTKEILAHLLSYKFKVYKTEANNNNHIGVPLTILSAPADSEMLIVEHGTNHFGEIEFTAKIAEPDIALITNIGDSHLEFLGNRDGVFREKKSLLDVTSERGGTVLLNMDDKYISSAADEYSSKATWALNSPADFSAEINEYSAGSSAIRITGKDFGINLSLPLPGEINVVNFLAAAAASITAGFSHEYIPAALEGLKPFKGRLNYIKTAGGLIIDDTYNANPDSVRGAISVLAENKEYARRIFILGDMFELGGNSAEMHRELAPLFETSGIETVYLLGEMTENLFNVLKQGVMDVKWFGEREELSSYLKGKNFDNNAILVKGSRGMRMEEFVKILEEGNN